MGRRTNGTGPLLSATLVCFKVSALAIGAIAVVQRAHSLWQFAVFTLLFALSVSSFLFIRKHGYSPLEAPFRFVQKVLKDKK